MIYRIPVVLMTLPMLLPGCDLPAYDTLVIDGTASVIVDETLSSPRGFEAACGPDGDLEGVTLTPIAGALEISTNRDDCTFVIHGAVHTVRSETPGTHLALALSPTSEFQLVAGDAVDLQARGNGPARIEHLIAATATVGADGQSTLHITTTDAQSLYSNSSGSAVTTYGHLDVGVWDVMMRGTSTVIAAGDVDLTRLDMRGNALLVGDNVTTGQVEGSVGGNAQASLRVLGSNTLDVFGNASVEAL